MDTKKYSPGYFEQLALGLDIDAFEDSGKSFVFPDEADKLSELARLAFEQVKGNDEDSSNLSPDPIKSIEQSGEDKHLWMDTYFRLREAGWPWRVACYISWAASPKTGRWPKTKELLAQQVLGLNSDRVIGTWRSKNPVIDEVIALLQAAPLLDHRADIYRALVASASMSDHRSHQDRKLALELMGDYVPHAKIDVGRGNVDDLSQLSDEELDKLARQVLGGKASLPIQKERPEEVDVE